MIRKLAGQNKWRLYSKESHKNLGTFGSKSAAVVREKQIQFFKHRSVRK